MEGQWPLIGNHGFLNGGLTQTDLLYLKSVSVKLHDQLV